MAKLPVTARRLAELRAKRGVDQADVARAIGTSQGRVSEHESGTTSLTLPTLIKYARYYDVTSSYLLGETDNPKGEADDDKIVPTDDEALLLQAFRDGWFQELADMLIAEAKKRGSE
ncbi:MAG: helix-turn-helix transcriptional regulator [Anaerolineae bacterium]|nr:helix-turn-helix transcriptional regulator [Anaerolineae bacterium]